MSPFESLKAIQSEIDDLVPEILNPLRLDKHLNDSALRRLRETLDRLIPLIGNEELVPRKLVGDLWHIFTSMLAEADHTQNARPIIEAAWSIQDRLQDIFGPRWDEPNSQE